MSPERALLHMTDSLDSTVSLAGASNVATIVV